MIKKEIYPKTKRIPNEGERVIITEKLDGSNLVIMKREGEIYICQRKNIYRLEEKEEAKGIMYKGLKEWLDNYGERLKEDINEGSVICCEYIGMGNIKYSVDEFDKRVYMFAKANVNEKLELYNIKYNHNLFKYSFKDENKPYYIGEVPVVLETKVLPDKKLLDSEYKRYVERVKRPVEGFVVNVNDNISKYVRVHRGKVVEYDSEAHKGAE